MLRFLIVLFWISLIVGTYATGNVVGNWIVCLLGLLLLVRSRRKRPTPQTLQPTRSATVSDVVTGRPLAGRHPAPLTAGNRLEHRPRRRWR
jgi:hypothetical protein